MSPSSPPVDWGDEDQEGDSVMCRAGLGVALVTLVVLAGAVRADPYLRDRARDTRKAGRYPNAVDARQKSAPSEANRSREGPQLPRKTAILRL